MATLDLSVAAGGDDGHVIDDLLEFHGTDQFLFWGQHWLADDETAHAFVRFTGGPPQGATITAAYLQFAATDEGQDEGPGLAILSNIFGVDEDASAAPTTYATWSTDHGLHTTASVAWDFTGLGSGTLTSPSIVSIIQEIVDRAGYSGTIQLHIDDDGTTPTGGENQRLQTVASFEDALAAPLLHIEYTSGIALEGSSAGSSSVDAFMGYLIRPTSDHTISLVVDEDDETSDLYASVDDLPFSPDDTDYINNSIGPPASVFLGLTDLPTNFATMSGLTLHFRYRAFNGDGTGIAVHAQVFAADESTPLTDEELVQSVGGTGTNNWGTGSVTFSGVVASNKTTWNGARLRLRWVVT